MILHIRDFRNFLNEVFLCMLVCAQTIGQVHSVRGNTYIGQCQEVWVI